MTEIPDLDGPTGGAGKPEELLELALAIDNMDADATPWEGSFLDTVLPVLKSGRGITEKQEKSLREMHQKYKDRGKI